MNQETWLFINTFAPWLAALGTLSAVVTSLYLARKGNRIELEVRGGLRQVAFLAGSPPTGVIRVPANPPELVWIGITNVGRRSANINVLYWKPLPWRKRGLTWYPPQNGYSSSFPVTLADGESANYGVSVPEFEKKIGNFLIASSRGCLGPSSCGCFACAWAPLPATCSVANRKRNCVTFSKENRNSSLKEMQ